MIKGKDTPCKGIFIIFLLLAVLLLSKNIGADQFLYEWDQCDILHNIGEGDCSSWSNVDESGIPVAGDLIDGFNPQQYPDGVWLDPGYYRLIIETSIDHNAGEENPYNDPINSVTLSSELGDIDWIKPKPSYNFPFLREYYRGSFPAGYPFLYQTGTFFLETRHQLSIVLLTYGTDVLHVSRVWLFRNVDPDPGSLRVLTWNLKEDNAEVVGAGRALHENLNRPDLAAFQELSYNKRKSCDPGLFDKENCILGIMTGYAESSSMNLGNFGFSDGDFFDVFGIGNWQIAWDPIKEKVHHSHTDHYQGIIVKKNTWLQYFDDPNMTYQHDNKGVGEDGLKHHTWGFGTYNCTDTEGCWHCPWPAENIDYEDCCAIDPVYFGNKGRCRNNYYFTNDHQNTYKFHNGRHLTARFSDRTGKEGVIVTTHLKSGGSDDDWDKRRMQMVDIIDHVTDDYAMYGMYNYGMFYFTRQPLVIVGDTNLRHDEQFKILDAMKNELEISNKGGIIDLTLSHNAALVDTVPGKHCGNTGELDPFDKIYLLGGTAPMDNDIEFHVGNHIAPCGDCCNASCTFVDTCTDHYPVYATLAARTTGSIDNYLDGLGVKYSAETGENPDLDMKFEWQQVQVGLWQLLKESRYGMEPFAHPDVKEYASGIEGMAASFEGNGYVTFPHWEPYSTSRRLSIELWIKPEQINPPDFYPGMIQGLVTKGQEDRINYTLVLRSTENPNLAWIDFNIFDDCTTRRSADGKFNYPPIEVGKWHHLLVSYDGLHAKIIVTKVHGIGDYEILGGEEEYMGANVQMCIESGPLWIGARYIDGIAQNYYWGEMDDLQIYTEAAR